MRVHQSPHRRTAFRAVATIAVVAVLLALSTSSIPMHHDAPTSMSPPRSVLTIASSGNPCPGSRVGAQYHGNVTDAGGGTSAPSIANQSVLLSYRYTQTFLPQSGGPAQYLCIATVADGETGPTGSFSVNATIASSFCSKPYGCWNYTGPYGPATLDLGGGALPAGYYLNESVSHGSYRLTRVLALDRVALLPSGFTTVSVDAPTVVVANALSGLGTPSPSNLSYSWSVAGTGWRVLSPLNGSHLTVEAVSTSYVATVEVWVNGSYGGATQHAPSVSVLLTAATTTIQSGSVRPTSVDEGVPTTFTWSGTGADGYAYTATLAPGFNLPRLAGNCTNRSIAGGLLELDCSVSYSYSQGGLAQPFATLSNPFSSANFTFAQVTVSARLGVGVTPDPAAAYPGDPIGFTVVVDPGSGSAPFGPACLSDGTGNTTCQRSSGPPWQFSVTYANLGRYQAEASVADAGGTNFTSLIAVSIAPRPHIDGIAIASTEVPQGGNLNASADVLGGAFPLAYWWNTTTASTVGAGQLTSDGRLSISFAVGTTPTGSALTLTVVDALGTVVQAVAPYYVVATTAVAIDLVGPPYASAPAGSPVSLSFEAVDVLQDPAVGFSGSFGVVADPPGIGGVWVNGSAVGPILPTAGTFVLPANAWSMGFLNLTLSEGVAGVFNITFQSPGVSIAGPPPLRLTVGPDSAHERLLHPDTVHAGHRANATLYEIQDRFGNAVPGGYVIVQSIFGPTPTNIDSPIRASNGASFVWVNYTAVGNGGGLVNVLSASGRALLPTITVPPLASASVSPLIVVALGAVASVALVSGLLLARRRRSDPPETPVGGEEAAVEEGLKRLAQGRAHVLERVPFDTPVDLDHIALGWVGSPPDAAELAEWVGSLVSEGALRASIGPAGRPMFVRVEEAATSPSTPRVEVDPMALDAALERLRFESADPDGPPGPSDP